MEEHPVRFEKLKDAKQNIERINNSLEQINQEIQDLDEILDNFGELDKQQNRLLTDDIKRKYQNVLECQKNLRGAEQRIEENRLQCRELETKIEARKKEIRNTQEQYDKVKDCLLYTSNISNFVPNGTLTSIRKQKPREGTKTCQISSPILLSLPLENKSPERGRKPAITSLLIISYTLENKSPERGRKQLFLCCLCRNLHY